MKITGVKTYLASAWRTFLFVGVETDAGHIDAATIAVGHLQRQQVTTASFASLSATAQPGSFIRKW